MTRDSALPGGYQHERREIFVRPDRPAQMFTVLVHEAAHELSHGHDDGRHGRDANEVIVQSIAFIVGDAFGIDAGAMSAHYVAGWLRADPEGFKKGQTFIADAARSIIDTIAPAVAAADESLPLAA
jgi:predicted Zn-dependent protease